MPPPPAEAELIRRIRHSLEHFSIPTTDTTSDPKEIIRLQHKLQRAAVLQKASSFLSKHAEALVTHFASGQDICPEKISPRLELVNSDSLEARIFRLATLTWSVPVSEGYGRRMRFLVWDDYNDKLIGVIAIGDPVFNLKVRDDYIGWSSSDREKRLVGVMDAFVLGAVPPYNMLLGGKMVSCLVKTREVKDAFRRKYAKTTSIISQEDKRANLVLITTSSSLGKSSVYNRLKISGEEYFSRLGYTAGYGHFHVSNSLFDDMRELLLSHEHPYANGNRFGNGPNWKFRAIRAALQLVGFGRDHLRHGIKREVFECKVASNAHEILRGEAKRPDYSKLLSSAEIGALARERWILPRANTQTGFKNWESRSVLNLVKS